MNTNTKFTSISSVFISAFSIMSLSFLLMACDTEEENTVLLSNKEELTVAENTEQAEQYSNEDLSIITLAEEDLQAAGRSGAEAISLCAVRTWVDSTKTLILDFGEGCTGPYGRTRSGKIFIAFEGEPGALSNSKTITFENYFIQNRQVTGTILVERFMQNEAGNYYNTFSLVDYTIIFEAGRSLTLNGSREREFLEGFRTSAKLVMKITGSMNGEDTRGRSFTSEITEPIISDVSCAESGGFIRVAGVRQSVYEGLSNSRIRTVYYGDGSCDSEIVIKVNGESYTISK